MSDRKVILNSDQLKLTINRLSTEVIENHIEADTDSQEFINHIGDILVVLLDEKLKDEGPRYE